TSSFFVYKGSANSVNVTGLTTGTSYTFKIYAYTDAGSVYEYSSGTQTTQSVSIPDITSAISFNGNGSANISWTNPRASCYDDVMAVVTTTAGIT
ncbi:fibronectin type III domain-containing protein, partial [Salmonella sp. s29923]|uniref:fibronectin type III domain-containing protein n=1 Tax=Salmonella sp. s29923 TaxID=3159635 RepID=UPI00397E9744